MRWKVLSKESSWKLICYRVGLGIVLKFMLGSDDLAWLSPFMARARSVPEKMNIGIKYVLSVLFLTLLACALAVFIHFAAGSSHNDELVDQSIATVAASLLFAYAMNMAYDEGYFDFVLKRTQTAPSEEEDDDLVKKDDVPPAPEYGAITEGKDAEEEEIGPIKAFVRKVLLGMSDAYDTYCSCVDPDTRELEKDLADEEGDGVVIVAFLGSMDDFMVYFTLALSHQLTWFELTTGVTLGSILLAGIVAVLLQSSENLANLVEAIPIPLVLTGLSVFILVSAWTSFDGF